MNKLLIGILILIVLISIAIFFQNYLGCTPKGKVVIIFEMMMLFRLLLKCRGFAVTNGSFTCEYSMI
jgi:hypothetical protein